MKTLRSGVALILVVALSICLCACGGKTGEIENLTNKFENSCNKLDLNEMLECIEPEIASSIKLLTGIAGMFSDKDTDELLDEFAKTLFTELPENSQEFFSSISIELEDVKVDENKATANANITYEISGDKYEKTTGFNYKKINNQWYISNINFK